MNDNGIKLREDWRNDVLVKIGGKGEEKKDTQGNSPRWSDTLLKLFLSLLFLLFLFFFFFRTESELDILRNCERRKKKDKTSVFKEVKKESVAYNLYSYLEYVYRLQLEDASPF